MSRRFAESLVCSPVCSLVLAAVALSIGSDAKAEDRPPPRRPIAVELLEPSGDVLVANRSGSLMRVSVDEQQVVWEAKVAERLSDLAPLGREANRFLATDETSHELLEIRVSEDGAAVESRFGVAPYPVSVRATSDGARASVASLWSRRLTLLKRSEPGSKSQAWAIEHTVDLPFAPREQIVLPGDEQLAVFDSFGGQLAIVEIATGKITLRRGFPGHAVRGLVLSPEGDMLLAAHQMLNPDAHVNRSDIHWGLLMSNDLRWMKLSSLLDSEREIYAGGRVHPLGVPGRGGGDPAGVAITRSGTVVVCLAGVNQVMIGTHDDLSLRAVPVGRRPTAVALAADHRRAIVANTHDDSLSVVDIGEVRTVATISLGGARGRTPIELGEELFHDARLSHEGWMSCHSCHTDGHSNFTRNDNLSDGGFGAPKMVISLLGRQGTEPFAWDGSVATLAEQVKNSVHKTMQSDRAELSDEEVAALAAYMESLPPPPSVERLRGTADVAAIERGRSLFETHDCARCHAPPAYTVATLEEAGTRDERGRTQFNPPSLRGVSQRDALLHDGRARTLEALFREHGHPADQAWSAEQARDLAAFLRSLE
jgi:cytochrome c peroxidase